uniref:Chondroitin proteoglycan 2 n=1 Tax=Bursaphelenchus xylophilus TaxID=6326 RepID=A0A1I7SAL6_BURXY
MFSPTVIWLFFICIIVQVDAQRRNGPLILRRSLEEICLQTLQNNLHPDLQLGQCTPYFIRCQFDENNRVKIRLGGCSNGKVFLGDRCTSVEKMGKACLDQSVNLVNAASGVLAQATGFCEKNTKTPAVFFGAETDCSQQAILCIPGGEVPAIPFACPIGLHVDPNSLACVFADPGPCRFGEDKATIFFPVQATLNRLWCRREAEERDNGHGLSRSGDFAAEPDSIRCRNWFVSCEKRNDLTFGFCSTGSIFDRKHKGCRKLKEKDQCPAQFDCVKNPWQNIVPDPCKPDFTYCKGATPVEFRCPKDSILGEDGECVSKEFVGTCQPKPAPDCINGEVYDKNGNPCPDIPMIPERECEDGESKALKESCSLFKRCINGHYELRRCPKGSGFHPKVKECETTYKCPENDGDNIYDSDYNYSPTTTKKPAPPPQPQDPYNPQYPNPPYQHWSPHSACREDPGIAGYHRDPLNCANFYQCASGRWVHKNCAPGTHFNPNGPFCDHIGNVPGCPV